MLPLWIINLSEDAVSNRRLQELIAGIPGKQGRIFWHYTGVLLKQAETLEDYRRMMEEVVDDGKTFYNALQQQGIVIENLQVCILGSVPEDTTLNLFQLLPIFLHKALPGIVSMSVHRGIQVSGFLYIPHNLNQAEKDVCRRTAVFLEELNLLVEDFGVNYYNRVVLYQNIQWVERFYPELNVRERTELLFQYLLNVYYREQEERVFFPELGAPRFYALGAASLYYDSEQHRNAVLQDLLEKMLAELKNPDNFSQEESQGVLKELLNKNTIGVEVILDRLQGDCGGLELHPEEMEGEPDPHPVRDFAKARLYPAYYLDYLRFMPARAVEFARAFSYMLTRRFFAQSEENRKSLADKLKEAIRCLPEKLYSARLSFATLAQLKDIFLSLKEQLEKEKETCTRKSGSEPRTVYRVPDFLKTYYTDLKQKGGGRTTEKEIADRMQLALRSEPTVMALLSRCFLLGTALVFVVVPLLRWLSPFVIDLGNVAEQEWLWIIVVFLLPFLYHFLIRLRRHFLFIRKQKHLLLAQALLEAQRKASARVFGQALELYNELIAFCEEQLKACDVLAETLTAGEAASSAHHLPDTLFNQPLIGGRFNGSEVVDMHRLDDTVKVGSSDILLSRLKQEHYISLLRERTPLNGGLLPLLQAAATGNGLTEENRKYVQAVREELTTALSLKDDENLGRYIGKLEQKDPDIVNLEPLLRMAGVNGMLLDGACQRGWHIRAGGEFFLPKGYQAEFAVQPKAETRRMVFVASWCELRNLNSYMICGNTESRVGPHVPLPVRITSYYARFTRSKNLFMLREERLEITLKEMEELDRILKDMGLWE